jgi:hypothetical protein
MGSKKIPTHNYRMRVERCDLVGEHILSKCILCDFPYLTGLAGFEVSTMMKIQIVIL